MIENHNLSSLATKIFNFLKQFTDNEFHNIKSIIKNNHEPDIIDALNELADSETVLFLNYIPHKTNETVFGDMYKTEIVEDIFHLPITIWAKINES